MTTNKRAMSHEIDLKPLTKKQALVVAVKLWGKKAAVRDEGIARASTPAKRTAARATLIALRETIKTPEEKRAQQKALDTLIFECGQYRFAVGYIALGLFFSVQGQGDTWQEAFAKARQA